MFARLLDVLFPPRSDEAVVRTLTTNAVLALLAPTLLQDTKPATIGLLPFSDTRVRALIHEAKYHGSERALTLLGCVLDEYLRDADERRAETILVPIPLGSARRRERGHNQAESLCALAAKQQSISLVPALLRRTRETVSQTSLPRAERLANMHGAFEVSVDQAVSPTVLYILIDDVVTTGATLQAAIDALTAGGARHIIPIACAH